MIYLTRLFASLLSSTRKVRLHQKLSALPCIAGYVLLLALLALAVACVADEAPTFTAPPTPPQLTATLAAPPLLTQPPLPSETPTLSPVLPDATPSPDAASWYGTDTMALIVSGDDERADLYAVARDGATWLLRSDVGNDVTVSSDGRWLGFVRWSQDGRAALELHDARSGEGRQITPETTSGLVRFVFAPDGRRLVYLDLGAITEKGVPWALVALDLESGAVSRYEALMVDGAARPLPGAPLGWAGAAPAGDELVIDTFLPYTEGGWMGVWGVMLPSDGAPVPLDTLPLRELIPATAYSSALHLAPDRQVVAFLSRDADYVPDNYFPEFYDLAVNRLAMAGLADGARTLLVEARDGSALARALAWSPSGERLLFAQGFYDGESFDRLSLKSTDRGGAVVDYGPLELPPLGGLLKLAWCDPSLALYLLWDGSDGRQRLHAFDLNVGTSTEISVGGRLEIVGCAQ